MATYYIYYESKSEKYFYHHLPQRISRSVELSHRPVVPWSESYMTVYRSEYLKVRNAFRREDHFSKR